MILPIKTAYKLAELLADLKYLTSPRDRLNVQANLRIILDTNDEKYIKKSSRTVFRNFAKYLVEFFSAEKFDNEFAINNLEIKNRKYLNLSRKLLMVKPVLFGESIQRKSWLFKLFNSLPDKLVLYQ